MKSPEFRLIDAIASVLGPGSTRVVRGIGDDAAVVEPGRLPALLCSDAMVEGVHFRLDWAAPAQLGHKALASVLSDIAAMLGRPRCALVSLALRPGLGEEFVREFYRGMGALASRHGVDVVGGDLTRARSESFIDVMVLGEAERPALRSGARPGDLIAVSGTVGTSAAGLFLLQSGLAPEPELVRAHLEPEPRLDLVPLLRAPGLVTSLIDVSDGVASELHHLAEGSAVGLSVEESRLPLHPATRALAQDRGLSPWPWAWSGGEDYQLLMTLDPGLWDSLRRADAAAARQLTIIGEVRPGAEGTTVLRESGGREPLPRSGWDPFREADGVLK